MKVRRRGEGEEQDNNDELGGGRPLYTFTGMFNFAPTLMRSFLNFEQVNANPLISTRPMRNATSARVPMRYFVQDDWKVSSATFTEPRTAVECLDTAARKSITTSATWCWDRNTC